MKVCIDAGHAKSTAGKRSPDGSLMEYEFNRAVAKRLKHHLERHGVECFYSCDIETERDAQLSERVRRANLKKADYFISIHANAYGEGDWTTANGWECYICAKGGNGEKLARKIEKESIPYLGLRNRGVKVNNFYVIEHTNMPAVLVEHGFYTNQEECALLKTSEFREKCAIADAKGILNHFDMDWQEEVKEEDMPSDWAKEVWQWAKDKGICDGSRPREVATREEVVSMLQKYENRG